MEIVLEIFGISLPLKAKLDGVTERRQITNSVLASRTISMAYQVTLMRQAKRNIYAGTSVLILPDPKQLTHQEDRLFEVDMLSDIQSGLEAVTLSYGISKQSVLNWGLECLEIVEDALIWDQIITDGPGGPRPIRLGWIHSPEAD